MKAKWVYIATICAYAVLTLYLFFPVVADPVNQVITYPQGGTSGDQWVILWNFWWIKYSLLDLWTNPFITHHIFYPNTVSLAMHETTMLNALLSIPFQLLLPGYRGLVLAYNTIYLATSLLSGLAMFILIRCLTKSYGSAFVCGLIYMLIPYKIAQCVHLNLLSLQYLPLYVLFFYRTITTTQWRNVFFAVLFFFFIIWTCYQYVVFTILFSAAFLFFWAIFNFDQIKDKARIKRIALLVVCSLLVVTPNLYMILSLPNTGTPPFWQTMAFTPDLLGFFLPPETALWSGILRLSSGLTLLYQNNVSGYYTYFGITLIGLAIFGALKTSRNVMLPWLAAAAFFFLLALGPYLVFAGTTHENIPLPYLFFYKYIPMFKSSRVPFRFVVLVELCLLVLAGYGIKAILARFEGAWRHRIAFALMILLVLLDYMNKPYRTLKIDVPPVYAEIAQEKGDFAILDSPSGQYYDACRYMFYQTTHHKPIWHGITARIVFIDTVPIREKILRKERDSLPLDPETLRILQKYNTRYLIRHASHHDLHRYEIEDILLLAPPTQGEN